MGWREYHELTKHSVESLRGVSTISIGQICPIDFGMIRGRPLLAYSGGHPASSTDFSLAVLEGKAGLL